MMELFFVFVGLIALLGLPFYWYEQRKLYWHPLINCYKSLSVLEKDVTKLQSIYFKEKRGWSQWNSCYVSITDEGLSLSHPKIVSRLIPSILIPWTDILDVKEKRIWMRKCVRFKIRNQPHELAFAKTKHIDQKIGKYLRSE